MPGTRDLARQRRIETPLLALDNDHAMTEFWSPRRPAMAPPSTPTAPPSSPMLDASNPDFYSQRYLPSQYKTLTYLNQQLEERMCKEDPRHSQIMSFNRPSHRFSWQSDCSSSSDGECTTEDPCTQPISIPDDDGATLVDFLSPVQSDCSEANTISGDSMDSCYPSSTCWKENFPKLDYNPRKAWSATVPFRKSAAPRPTVLQLPYPATFHTPDYGASCSSRALANRAISPLIMKSTSIHPTHSDPSPQSMDMRSQSWPGFADGTCSPGSAIPVPPGQADKSFWDPDSSDDEKEMASHEQSLGKLRRRFGRRVSDTLRPLSCRT